MTYGCCVGTGRNKKVLKDRKSEAIGQQCLLYDMRHMPGETETLFLTASVGHDNGTFCSTMMAVFFVFI
jgi:hypothetical protein